MNTSPQLRVHDREYAVGSIGKVYIFSAAVAGSACVATDCARAALSRDPAVTLGSGERETIVLPAGEEICCRPPSTQANAKSDPRWRSTVSRRRGATSRPAAMSIRLRELIKSVRQCKTAADERNVIAKESAALRNAFREQDSTYRHRNVAKLMYMHMLGYPTHFGQMECLKLIAAPSYPEKRIGYLALMLLLDERTEVLMLVTNSIKNDLAEKSQYVVGLALCALGNIGSMEMCRDLSPEIVKLLQHSNPYIRKKAALCAVRIVRKVPDMIEDFQDCAADLLTDRHHGVLLAGCTLLLEMCKITPELAQQYASQTKHLVKILKQLVLSSYSPEHDVNGINDPFLQCRILRLLRRLGKGNSEASDVMSDILAQVATNTEPTRNSGNAILYECVETIMGVESTQGLRVLAVNIMGRFLSHKDNNSRYVALNTLSKVVSVDTQTVQRHRNTIVDCVKDSDVSIRRRALELVYALINEANIKTLTKELLDYLDVSDNSFKPDLTAKIAQLVQKFAPDRRWYMDNMVALLTQAGPYVKPEIWRSLIVVITNTPELQGYMVRTLFKTVSSSLDKAAGSLVLVSVWVMGEYGDVLVDGSSPRQADEEPLKVAGADMVRLLEVLLTIHTSDTEIREYIVTALVKLAAHVAETRPTIESVVHRFTSSSFLEVQQRSCEFDKLLKNPAPGLFMQLMEHMPPLTEAEYMKATGASTLQSSELLDQSPTKPAAAAPSVDALADLMGMDLLNTSSAPAAPAVAVDPIQDLLGLDLTPPSAAAAAPAPVTSLDDLFGPPASQPPQPAPSQAAPQVPPVTVFDKDGVLIVMSFSKPNPAQPEITDALATMTNTGGSPIGNLSMQVAVPKFMQLRLDPASGSALQPGGTAVTQSVHLTNSMHGQKPMALRLRVSYVVAGQTHVEMAEVGNLPPGL